MRTLDDIIADYDFKAEHHNRLAWKSDKKGNTKKFKKEYKKYEEYEDLTKLLTDYKNYILHNPGWYNGENDGFATPVDHEEVFLLLSNGDICKGYYYDDYVNKSTELDDTGWHTKDGDWLDYSEVKAWKPCYTRPSEEILKSVLSRLDKETYNPRVPFGDGIDLAKAIIEEELTKEPSWPKLVSKETEKLEEDD